MRGRVVPNTILDDVEGTIQEVLACRTTIGPPEKAHTEEDHLEDHDEEAATEAAQQPPPHVQKAAGGTSTSGMGGRAAKARAAIL